MVSLFTHSHMVAHNAGEGHPERPARLTAVLDALADAGLARDRREATEASVVDLERVHPAAHVARLLAAEPATGFNPLDADTVLAPGSLRAARLAAGAPIDAVRAIAAGELTRAFAAVRPPGHHAEPDQAMGFCLFSNVAVAARVAQSLGMARVAVVDFDVHHGNGTQAAFDADDSLFLASIHQSPLYPGSGAASETGVGNIVNDPLAHQSLEAEDFAWATRAVLEIARRRCGGKVVSSLEGGYDLEGLGRSAVAHVQALGED
jgi:acetoin utilization deacetylase AcuC-like enzyme